MLNRFDASKALYTSKEVAVLSALASRDCGCDASDVTAMLTQACGREPRLATVYSVILSLREKGYIEPGDLRPAPSGGRPTQVWLVTKRGHLCIELAEVVLSGIQERNARLAAA